MEKTNFISGLNCNNSDFEKLFFHVFNEKIRKFSSKSKLWLNMAFFFSVLFASGVIILIIADNYSDLETVYYGLMILGGIGAMIFFILFFTLKINTSLNNVGIFNIPFYHSKLQDNSALVDLSGLTNDVEFNFRNLNDEQINNITKDSSELHSLINNYPVVINSKNQKEIRNNNDEFRKENLKIFSEEIDLLDKTASINDNVNSSDTYTVNFPVLKKDNDFIDFLRSGNNESIYSLLKNITEESVKSNFNKIDGIVDIYSNSDSVVDVDNLCSNLLKSYNDILPRYKYSLNLSMEKINKPANLLMNYQLHNISYNFYCPFCNEESEKKIINGKYYHDDKDVKTKFNANTKLELVDVGSRIFKCPLCEKETKKPIFRHKMDDELFTPMYDKLSEEHFKDRLNIYNSINDKKREFSEKAATQFHQVIRENRAKEDAIKSKIRTISAEILSEQSAIADLNALLLKYDRIEKERAQEIAKDIEEIKAIVEEENIKTKEEIVKTVAEAKQNIEETTEKYANLERKDQEKRDAVQKQIAENTAATANILHAMGVASGVIEEKSVTQQVVDSVMGNESGPGLNNDEQLQGGQQNLY